MKRSRKEMVGVLSLAVECLRRAHTFCPTLKGARHVSLLFDYGTDLRYPDEFREYWPKDWPPAFLWDFIYGIVITKVEFLDPVLFGSTRLKSTRWENRGVQETRTRSAAIDLRKSGHVEEERRRSSVIGPVSTNSSPLPTARNRTNIYVIYVKISLYSFWPLYDQLVKGHSNNGIGLELASWPAASLPLQGLSLIDLDETGQQRLASTLLWQLFHWKHSPGTARGSKVVGMTSESDGL